MIDYVSIGAKGLDQASKFYETILSEIGLSKLVEKTRTIGFGKSYQESWLNHRPILVVVFTQLHQPYIDGCTMKTHHANRSKMPVAGI